MTRKLNPGAIAGIIIGVITIIFAIVMISNAGNVSMSRLSSSDLSKSSQFQMKYSFGADFYTEMFGVTYNALQQLIGMSSDNAANLAAVTNKMVGGMHTGFSAVCNLLAWAVIAPVLDILMYAEPANKVFVQGLGSAAINAVATAVVGTLLLFAYAAAKPKKGSLKKEK